MDSFFSRLIPVTVMLAALAWFQAPARVWNDPADQVVSKASMEGDGSMSKASLEGDGADAKASLEGDG